MGWELAVVAAAALITGYLLCALMRVLAPGIGLVDEPHGRKSHAGAIPLGGGVAILLAMVVGYVAFVLLDQQGHAFGTITPFRMFVLAAGAAALFVTGLIDDMSDLNAWMKLIVQVAVACMLFFAGFKITLFIYSWVVNLAVTVFWLVLLMNAFNLLDTSDGLSSSVAMVIAAMMYFAIPYNDPQLSVLILTFFFACLGYLLHNFPPARLFMGDAGSLLLGYFLAVFSIEATFYSPSAGFDPFLAMLAPVFLFSVPIYDTLSVILIRIWTRKPLFVGDRNHFPHRLMALGLSKREVLLLVVLVTVVTSSCATYVTSLSLAAAFLLLLQVLAIFTLFFILETIGERKTW
ncbi:MAG: MraY family glycosyltransferase [Planctomycetota bacterium]|nr:MraY family glycosyltransferase [Planctomycetota bacterium]